MEVAVDLLVVHTEWKDGEEEECVEKKSGLIVVYLVRSMSTRIVRESYVYLVS